MDTHVKALAGPRQLGGQDDTLKARRVCLRGQDDRTGDPAIPDGRRGAKAIALLREMGVVVRIMKVDEKPTSNPLDNGDSRELPSTVRERVVLHDIRKLRKQKSIINKDSGCMRKFPSNGHVRKGPGLEAQESLGINVFHRDPAPDEDFLVGV